jgi:hypothetical protein
MKYCPKCGRELVLVWVKPDVDTEHHRYQCTAGHVWCETIDRYGGPARITEVVKESV